MLHVTESNVQRKKMIRYPRDMCVLRGTSSEISTRFWSQRVVFPEAQTDKRVNKCTPDFDEPDIKTLLLSIEMREMEFSAFFFS